MRDKKITIGKVIDMIANYHYEAVISPTIRKPMSWAIYQTWKWVDEHEKEMKKS